MYVYINDDLLGALGAFIAFAGVVVDGSAFTTYKQLKACGRSPYDQSIPMIDVVVSGDPNSALGDNICILWLI